MATTYLNPPRQLLLGEEDALNASGYALSAATGTKIFAAQFVAPVSQTSANLVLYLFQTATAGSPTSISARVYTTLATNVDRAQTALGDAAVVVDCSSASPEIRTFTFTGVTLVQNQTYIILVWNTTTTPGTNYPSIARVGGPGRLSIYQSWRCSASNATGDGLTSNILWSSQTGAFVLKFSDGLVMGNPFGGAVAHASNSNYRGNRIRVNVPVTVRGGIFAGMAAASSNTYFTFSIYSTAGTLLATGAGTSGPRSDMVYLSTPYQLSPGIDYDCVFLPSAASVAGTIGYAGIDAPPADVTSAMPQSGGQQISYLDGATPGSFTPDTKRCLMMGLVLDDLTGGAALSRVRLGM